VSSDDEFAARPSHRARVLFVDDDPELRRSMGRELRAAGYYVDIAASGAEAVEYVDQNGYDVVLSDIGMPEMDGIQLLREVRNHDLQVPVVLLTGVPRVQTAIQALEYGAFHYLTKPAPSEELTKILDKAARLRRMARLELQAAELLGHSSTLGMDRAGLEASFERCMESLWIAYHPIVDAKHQVVYGHEALLRSGEPSLPHPGAVLDAAERLGRLDKLGRAIRSKAAMPFGDGSQGKLFVNLHTTDLLDPTLIAPASPLTKIAGRVVLEITERRSLDEVRDVKYRVAQLRELGFQIAVDDMGAGYAGLTSFALLEPDYVKLDMSLIREVDQSRTRQKIIRSMTDLSRDMGMNVVAEGFETREELCTLIELGCDLFQGFLFAKPSRTFPKIAW
jgi:EAL domain-containing protein (putative c-di-GMP-specific phosphodiesterase class I)/CheY-like chemotaxis protein